MNNISTTSYTIASIAFFIIACALYMSGNFFCGAIIIFCGFMVHAKKHDIKHANKSTTNSES